MVQSSKFQFEPTKEFPYLPSEPIVEAVIHWQARAAKPWEPEALRDDLAAKLPNYTKCEPQRILQIRAEVDSEGAKTQTRRDSFLGFRLTSSDNLHIAQFNRDGLVFSRLKPYDEWAGFSEEGIRLWNIFLDLAGPSEVQRLGVRFINQIPLRQTSDIARVLKYPPRCLEPLGLPLSSFFYQSTHNVPEHPYGINVAQTIQPPIPPDSDEHRLILDIDVFTTDAFESKDEFVREHLPKMRFLKDKAFFSLLKPRAIQTFMTEEE